MSTGEIIFCTMGWLAAVYFCVRFSALRIFLREVHADLSKVEKQLRDERFKKGADLWSTAAIIPGLHAAHQEEIARLNGLIEQERQMRESAEARCAVLFREIANQSTGQGE